MASAASHAVVPGRSSRGRILIYVVGFNQPHWVQFPADVYRAKQAAINDVRTHLPRDPDAAKGKKGKGKSKGKKGGGRPLLVDDVVGMDGFLAACERVISDCLHFGFAIVGCLMGLQHNLLAQSLLCQSYLPSPMSCQSFPNRFWLHAPVYLMGAIDLVEHPVWLEAFPPTKSRLLR